MNDEELESRRQRGESREDTQRRVERETGRPQQAQREEPRQSQAQGPQTLRGKAEYQVAKLFTPPSKREGVRESIAHREQVRKEEGAGRSKARTVEKKSYTRGYVQTRKRQARASGRRAARRRSNWQEPVRDYLVASKWDNDLGFNAISGSNFEESLGMNDPQGLTRSLERSLGMGSGSGIPSSSDLLGTGKGLGHVPSEQDLLGFGPRKGRKLDPFAF